MFILEIDEETARQIKRTLTEAEGFIDDVDGMEHPSVIKLRKELSIAITALERAGA